MPMTNRLSWLTNNMLTTRNAARLAAGGAGITVALLALHKRILDVYPYPLPHYALTIGLVLFGLGMGILSLDAGIWIFKKIYLEKTETERGKLRKQLTDRPADRSRSTERSLESSSYIAQAETPRKTPVHTIDVKDTANKFRPSTSTSSKRLELTESSKHARRKASNLFPIVLITLMVLASLVIWAAWHFHQHKLPNENIGLNVDSTNEDSRRRAKAEEMVNKEIEKKPAELRPALYEYRRKSGDIDQILRDGLEEKNIGGAVAVAITNWQFNSTTGIYKQPEELGFQKVTNDEALINRALRNEVTINQVKISPLPNRKFKVTIQVTNLKPDALRCAIPKGQIFEMKDAATSFVEYSAKVHKTKMYPQGVAKSDQKGENNDEGIYVIPPLDEKTLEFIAYCVNEKLAIPAGLGNIAIYELKDKNFSSPDELHLNMRRENLEQIGFIKQPGSRADQIGDQQKSNVEYQWKKIKT